MGAQQLWHHGLLLPTRKLHDDEFLWIYLWYAPTSPICADESTREILSTLKIINGKLSFALVDVKKTMRPSSSKISQGRDDRFRKKLMVYYDNKPDKNGVMICLATNWKVPAEAIVAGHLFPMRLQVNSSP
jgi:hypothetical protein